MDKYPRDLLQRFNSGDNQGQEFADTADDTEEVELNLGLSLGGRFGMDRKEKKLVRSPSILGLMTPVRDDNIAAPPPVACHALIRACSLPTETEEEWRKRKELQSRRRMEARRKQSERQRSLRTVKDRGPSGLPSATTHLGQHSLAAAARGTIFAHGFDGSNRKHSEHAATLQGLLPPSPGSHGSQASSSSGVSEFESLPVQGLSNCTEARSPASVQSLREYSDQKPMTDPGTSTDKLGKPAGMEMDNSSKKLKAIDNELRGMGKNMMEEMPCVSTKGDGPNGRRIEGFLYRYGKGEEVRIVCVCHGRFLSPAEFVKHAGGGDVLHPLKHIVENSGGCQWEDPYPACVSSVNDHRKLVGQIRTWHLSDL